MKKASVILSVIFLFCVSAFAQTRPDYSGDWMLDKGKMKSAANSNVESMIVKATQSGGEIEIEVVTKLAPAPEDVSDDGQSKRGRRTLGDGTTVYSLDGKETIAETDSPAGKIPLKLQANFESDGRLNLSSNRTIKTPNGEVSLAIKEIWELADGGRTLKITREMKVPNGSNKVEMVFTKK